MRKISFLVLLAILANLVLGALALPAFAEGPVEGAPCTTVSVRSNGLICSKMCGMLWTVPGRCPQASVAHVPAVKFQDFAPTRVVNDTAKTIIAVRYPAKGVTIKVFRWPNATEALGMMFIGATMVADDITIVGIVNDPIALILIAGAGVYLIYPTVSQSIGKGWNALVAWAIQAPDHVVNHPRGDQTAQFKVAAWNVVMSAWFDGKPPDWCGKRDDGAVAVVYYSLAILNSTGKGLYRGLALILNGESGSSTSMWEIRRGSDGSPRNLSRFSQIPCPPPFQPAY